MWKTLEIYVDQATWKTLEICVDQAMWRTPEVCVSVSKIYCKYCFEKEEI